MKFKSEGQFIIQVISTLLLCFTFSACRKACIDVSLSELSCDENFISVSDAEYIGRREGWGYGRDSLVVIYDMESYKEAFPNGSDSMPLGYIDFSVKSLVGVGIYIDMGSGLNHHGGFCYNPSTKEWLFKIEYVVSDQCKGSGIYSSSLYCYIICPKLPPNADVKYTSRNINPI